MKIEKEILIKMYSDMVRIRAFEHKARDLFAAQKIPGFVHLYVGEEAIATGVISNLKPEDYIHSHHRGHGHLLVKGGDPNVMMAELFGKTDGYCKGKGGSMHIAAVDLGMLGANGIVGAGLTLAAGVGFALKYLKTDKVCICFFGDGSSNRGTFHEGLNMASTFKLPVVYVCENNQYGISNRQTTAMNITDISDRAGAYGIPGITVDGNDPVAVYEAAYEAIARARRGEGPSLIECKTWRHRGHFEGDPSTYKNPQEQAAWLDKDPIPQFAKKLLDLKYVDQKTLDSIKAKADQDIEAGVAFAEKSPYPEISELTTDVLA
ncbi:MAG: thiamine pyrophosphate-dependent dehydrogenase E1 component subunit alpha [Deltaproteobacteria bacterium]|jgi:pyruvate dehydrogenase E1 component alpha subunit|nr:thiamine pyrophosphate-dependent dehydrogenase E1 component subunit alpha [Deltaproteobacteria bacterium]